MKKLLIALAILAILLVVYLMGPTPETPVYTQQLPSVPPIEHIDDYVAQHEAQYHLRKDNHAQIIWADSTGKPTDYVLLYLHGFSASWMEGDPVNRNVAKYFGVNTYMARLAGHGLMDTLALSGFTPESAWESAQEALMIAHSLGNKVVIISTSTGSPLALKLAADYPDKVAGLVNLSPNLRIRNAAARILNDPWGEQIARLLYGKGRVIHHHQQEASKYWDTLHTPSALVALEELLETTMYDTLYAKVKCPVLTLYYYKDEQHQDEVVDVSVIPEMHKVLGTPDSEKKYVPLPTPGDHVIGSSIKSADYQVVEKEVKAFCRDVIGMPVKISTQQAIL